MQPEKKKSSSTNTKKKYKDTGRKTSRMGGMPGAMPGDPVGGAFDAATPCLAIPGMDDNAPNIEQTLQMTEDPVMRENMQNMMNNPDTMRRRMDLNPMVQRIRQTNPSFAMFNNPETVRLLELLSLYSPMWILYSCHFSYMYFPTLTHFSKVLR